MNNTENLLNAILKSAHDGVIIFDAAEYIQRINPVAESLTGWSQEIAIGRKLSEVFTLIQETDRQVIHISTLLRQPVKTGPLTELNIILVARDGQSTPVRASVSFVRNPFGEIQGGVIAFRNISELYAAYEQAQLQTRRANTLIAIISRLNSQLAFDNVLASLLKETALALEADGSAVILQDDDENTYRIVAIYSANNALEKFKGIKFDIENIEWDAKLNTTPGIVVIPDTHQASWLPFGNLMREGKIRAFAAAELRQQELFLGNLVVFQLDAPRQFHRDEQSFLKGLADHASMAIMNARLFEKVHASRARSQNLSKRLVEVQEAERRSMARELHDEIGQTLTGLQFSLESGKRLADGKLLGILNDTQDMVSGLIKQVRDLSLRLMPSMLDDMGLLPTLLWHFDRYTAQTGIQIDFSQFGLENRLPSEIEITAYRIIQECLTNIARYAQVNRAEVHLLYTDDQVLTVRVTDQGRGFDLQKTQVTKAFGLAGMRERAFLVGGQLTVKSLPEKGTEIVAVLPVRGRLERRKDDRKSDTR
jgi:PAS domain S-box-containing protein